MDINQQVCLFSCYTSLRSGLHTLRESIFLFRSCNGLVNGILITSLVGQQDVCSRSLATSVLGERHFSNFVSPWLMDLSKAHSIVLGRRTEWSSPSCNEPGKWRLQWSQCTAYLPPEIQWNQRKAGLKDRRPVFLLPALVQAAINGAAQANIYFSQCWNLGSPRSRRQQIWVWYEPAFSRCVHGVCTLACAHAGSGSSCPFLFL